MRARRQQPRRQEDAALMDKLDRNWRWLIVVVVVLLIGGVAEFVSITRQNDRLHTAAIHQCLRVQGLRDLVNYDNELMTVANLTVATVLAQKSLIKILAPGDAAARVRDTMTIHQLADQMLTEARTDCSQAVENPEGYKAPTPTRIESRLKPAPQP